MVETNIKEEGRRKSNSLIVLSEKQEAWLEKHYKNTRNQDIADKLGISLRSVSRLAKQRGLKKTPQFMRKYREKGQQAAHLSNLVNGTYPPKGYHIPRSEEFYFKKGESSRDRLGNKKEDERLRKSLLSRNETIKKERRRVLFGLPQKTKLRIGKQSNERVKQRCYLKKRGYIIDDDERIALWTSETLRATRLEAKENNVYRFAPAPM